MLKMLELCQAEIIFAVVNFFKILLGLFTDIIAVYTKHTLRWFLNFKNKSGYNFMKTVKNSEKISGPRSKFF